VDVSLTIRLTSSFLSLSPQNMLSMSRVCLCWNAFNLSQLALVSRRVSTPNKAELKTHVEHSVPDSL
jgi:hypothetical protein